MNTIDELVYYCKQTDPTGALLLTGEWGCGKSYLVKNEFKDVATKNEWVPVIISLFGISSADELRKEIKKQWFFACGDKLAHKEGASSKFVSIIRPVKTFIMQAKDKLPHKWGKVVDGVLSVDLFEMIQIQNYLDADKKKKVILIFDDLERTNIPTKDFMGVINDVCENYHFNTIVVANEEKIDMSNKDKSDYKEMKEKIISHTVKHSIDYSNIISGVIEANKMGTPSYTGFLRGNQEKLIQLFQGDYLEYIPTRKVYSSVDEKRQEEQRIEEVIKSRTHNIRSLESAIKDFERIYDILIQMRIDKCDKWLFSFVAYVLAHKSGLIKNNDYGFSENNLNILYPGYYNSRFIVSSEKKWIDCGFWDEDDLINEIKWTIEIDKVLQPVDLIRLGQFDELEERDIEKGYPQLLDLAYAGTLELDEYLNLIENAYLVREFKISLPMEADWSRIQIGIEKKIKDILEYGYEKYCIRKIINSNILDKLTEEERKAYQLIERIQNTNLLMFNNNRKLYIKLMDIDPEKALFTISEKRFNCFDAQMVEATYRAFKNCSNRGKKDFSKLFQKLWLSCIALGDIDKENLFPAMNALREKMINLQDEYLKTDFAIANRHTSDFINVIREFTDDESEMEDKNNAVSPKNKE